MDLARTALGTANADVGVSDPALSVDPAGGGDKGDELGNPV